MLITSCSRPYTFHSTSTRPLYLVPIYLVLPIFPLEFYCQYPLSGPVYTLGNHDDDHIYFQRIPISSPSEPDHLHGLMWVLYPYLYSFYTHQTMRQNFLTFVAISVLAAMLASAILWPTRVIAVALVFIAVIYWTRKS